MTLRASELAPKEYPAAEEGEGLLLAPREEGIASTGAPKTSGGKYEGGIVGHLVPRSQASRLATGIRRWRWHSVLSLCMFIVCGIFTITVNKESVVNIEGVFEKEALRVLHDIPEVSVVEAPSGRRRPDVVVRAGGVTCLVELKTQPHTNAAAARQLAEHARQLAEDTWLLLVARTTTAEARQILEDAGVAVIDGLGNMNVQLPGMFLRTEGQREGPPRHAAQTPVRLTGKAGVAVQALLLAPERLWGVHDLADEAGVSVGLAHRVLDRLERENVVAAEGVGPKRVRRVSGRTALLDLWAEEIRDRGAKQIRAFRLARDPRTLTAALSHALTDAGVEHAVTGAAAAAALAPFVTAIPVMELWVSETVALQEATLAAGAEVVEEGHNVVFAQARDDVPLVYRRKVDDFWSVNLFRLFYDLRRDPRRGREQAQRLREEVIGF